jgi:hypothetical protein
VCQYESKGGVGKVRNRERNKGGSEEEKNLSEMKERTCNTEMGEKNREIKQRDRGEIKEK